MSFPKKFNNIDNRVKRLNSYVFLLNMAESKQVVMSKKKLKSKLEFKISDAKMDANTINLCFLWKNVFGTFDTIVL